ncbi:MAG: class I SAM-dependent methyltransferase [Candidatus Marsarchaeota archaeon]|nr:class I SAM-dependent methyltransferase [Candidatus Marsarchaeota archaeon]
MEDNVEITRKTYDQKATLHADTHWSETFWAEEETKFEAYLGKGAKILDVGCGSGRDVKYFMGHGYDITGIDFSSGQLEEAKKRVPKGKFVLMDMRTMSFGSKTFDGLWCCSSLLHFKREELSPVLSELKRVMNESGTIFISVRKREDKEEWRKYPDGSTRFFSYYNDEKEFKDILESNGFGVLEYHLKHKTKDDAPYEWYCYYAKKK